MQVMNKIKKDKWEEYQAIAFYFPFFIYIERKKKKLYKVFGREGKKKKIYKINFQLKQHNEMQQILMILLFKGPKLRFQWEKQESFLLLW